jgi:hypothetical protein
VSARWRAAVESFGRVFAAAALAAYLELGKAPLDLGVADVEVLANAGIAAVVLTVVNALRRGETRFGRGTAEPEVVRS